MASSFTYALPVEQTEWKVGASMETTLRWAYDDVNRRGILTPWRG